MRSLVFWKWMELCWLRTKRYNWLKKVVFFLPMDLDKAKELRKLILRMQLAWLMSIMRPLALKLRPYNGHSEQHRKIWHSKITKMQLLKWPIWCSIPLMEGMKAQAYNWCKLRWPKKYNVLKLLCWLLRQLQINRLIFNQLGWLGWILIRCSWILQMIIMMIRTALPPRQFLQSEAFLIDSIVRKGRERIYSRPGHRHTPKDNKKSQRELTLDHRMMKSLSSSPLGKDIMRWLGRLRDLEEARRHYRNTDLRALSFPNRVHRELVLFLINLKYMIIWWIRRGCKPCSLRRNTMGMRELWLHRL